MQTESIYEKRLKILKAIADLGGEARLIHIEEKSGLDSVETLRNIGVLCEEGFIRKLGTLPIYELTERGKKFVSSTFHLTKEQISKILGPVQFGEGFHFYWDMGQYTGRSSVTLEDFCKILEEIDVRSIEFHNKNGDFEKWFLFLGDMELADEMKEIRNLHLKGDSLRVKIVEAVRRRISELLFLRSSISV
jgi:predicted transcriptional regulator